MARGLRSAAFFFAALLGPTLGAGAQSPDHSNLARYTIEIVGWVPVICRATLSEQLVREEEGLVDLGELEEFCNDSAGYQVWIDSQPGAAGTLYVDGQQVPLSETGATLVSASPSAARRVRHLALGLNGTGGEPSSLSIRVVAL